MAVVGMAANPSGAPAGRHRPGHMLPRHARGEVEGARGRAALPLPVEMSVADRHHGTRRFVTPTDSVAAARSNVAPEIFRAVTRTLLLDQTWQSSTNAMLLVSSEASA